MKKEKENLVKSGGKKRKKEKAEWIVWNSTSLKAVADYLVRGKRHPRSFIGNIQNINAHLCLAYQQLSLNFYNYTTFSNYFYKN